MFSNIFPRNAVGRRAVPVDSPMSDRASRGVTSIYVGEQRQYDWSIRGIQDHTSVVVERSAVVVEGHASVVVDLDGVV